MAALRYQFRHRQRLVLARLLPDAVNSRNRPVAVCRHFQDPTVKLQEADVCRTTKLGRLARGGFPRHGQAHLAAERSRPGWN